MVILLSSGHLPSKRWRGDRLGPVQRSMTWTTQWAATLAALAAGAVGPGAEPAEPRGASPRDRDSDLLLAAPGLESGLGVGAAGACLGLGRTALLQAGRPQVPRLLGRWWVEAFRQTLGRCSGRVCGGDEPSSLHLAAWTLDVPPFLRFSSSLTSQDGSKDPCFIGNIEMDCSSVSPPTQKLNDPCLFLRETDPARDGALGAEPGVSPSVSGHPVCGGLSQQSQGRHMGGSELSEAH